MKEQLIPVYEEDSWIIPLYSKLTGKPESRVKTCLDKEIASIGTNVKEDLQSRGLEPGVWSSELINFYSNTDSFLYETLVWNRTGHKKRLRKYILSFLNQRSNTGLKILTYGDGLGIDSLFLAHQGHEVTYFEPSQLCRKFAQSLFDHHKIKITIISSETEITRDAFDVIT